MKVVKSLVRMERNNIITSLTPPWRTLQGVLGTNLGKVCNKEEKHSSGSYLGNIPKYTCDI